MEYTKLTNLEVTGSLKVGGSVEINGALTLGETGSLPAATTSAAGVVKQGVAVADAASTAPTAAEFKALLDSLRDAGIIAEAAT